MSKQTLVFNYASKQAIPLNLVNVNNIIISE